MTSNPNQKRRIKSKADNKGTKKDSSKVRRYFTWTNFSRVILPSLVLLLIILTPVIFERLKTRHQKSSEVILAPVPGDWFDGLFNGGAPDQDVDPDDPDDPDFDGFMDGFTNGVNDPERILFRITPTDHFLYWRLQAYDTYNMEGWDRNITTYPIAGYSTLPSHSDGEFTVTAGLAYIGGTLVGNFPATYHYQYGEEISNDYSFSPRDDWIPATTTLEEDKYGCKSFNAHFVPQFGNITLTYPVAYTLQDNDFIRDNCGGFSSLEGLISVNLELEKYLQLPQNYSAFAPTTHEIASELLNPSHTIYNQIIRNMMWLSKNATYDIDMLMGRSDESPASGEDYVEWFLNRRMGTAAHFAAALAVICRLQNIPSRIIVGFSYGEQFGNEFIIRAKHAHSWIEAFLPITGDVGRWVQFDPSPLIPGLRDQYGENMNSFQFVFHCSNEFFLSPEHMYRLTVPPYFVPNSASDAWYRDPYNPSDWYGPYVNRTEPFDLTAFLGSGKDEDFLQYLTSGDWGDLLPIEGEQIDFIDTLTGNLIGTAITDSDGIATATYAFPLSAESGLHVIVAEWEGLQIPTYDLRFITESLVETGVIVTSVINITSSVLPSIFGHISPKNDAVSLQFEFKFSILACYELLIFNLRNLKHKLRFPSRKILK